MNVKRPVKCLLPTADGVVHSAEYLHRNVSINDINIDLVTWLKTNQFTINAKPKDLQFAMTFLFKEVFNETPCRITHPKYGKLSAVNCRHRIANVVRLVDGLSFAIKYKEDLVFPIYVHITPERVGISLDHVLLAEFEVVKRHTIFDVFNLTSRPYARVTANEEFSNMLENYSNSPFKSNDSLLDLGYLTRWFKTAGRIGIHVPKFEYVMGLLYNGYNSRYTGMLVGGKHNKMYPVAYKDLYKLNTTVIAIKGNAVVKHFHYTDGTSFMIRVNIESDKLTFNINNEPWLTVEKC